MSVSRGVKQTILINTVNIFQSIFRELFGHNIPKMFLITINVLTCLYIVENVLSPLHYDSGTPSERSTSERAAPSRGTRPALPLAASE